MLCLHIEMKSKLNLCLYLSLPQFVRITLLTLDDRIHIFKPWCNILYLLLIEYTIILTYHLNIQEYNKISLLIDHTRTYYRVKSKCFFC